MNTYEPPDLRKGSVHTTSAYGCLRVLRYLDKNRVRVAFKDTGYKTTVRAQHIRSGAVKDLMRPSIFGVGFIGVGSYEANKNGKSTAEYALWFNMMTRVYDSKYHARYPTYTKCRVVREWHNFQTFAAWCQKQKGFGRSGWQLDKDILIEGNKIYSPATCCFVPHEINKLLTKSDAVRGSHLIGVSLRANGSFVSYCSDGTKKNVLLGIFDSELDAYKAYKNFKEDLIRKLAARWQNQMLPAVYAALLAYRVRKSH